MKKAAKETKKGGAEIGVLRHRLEEAEETLRAIRTGGVDALVVSGPHGDQVYLLKGAEHPYRVFVETMEEGAATLGLDGTILYCNNRMAELSHKPIEKVIGGSVFDLIAPADRENFRSLFECAWKKNCQGEVSFSRPSGDSLPVYLSLNPLPADDVVAVCLVATDLTERKKAELATSCLAVGLEQSDESVAIMDRRGNVSRVNPAFERLNGCSKEDIVGKSYVAFLTGRGGDPEIVAQIREALRLGHAWNGRMARRQDAFSRVLDVTISPVKDAAGTVLNFFAVGRDVTREVISEKNLRQRQKLEALGTLSSGVAHDLNNILAPIMANAELALLDMPESAPAREHLKTALRAVIRGKELVKRILAFSAPKEQNLKPLTLGPVVRESLKLIRASLPASIEIRQKIHDFPDMVLADPTQLQEVIINLAGNAADAMRPAGGVLEVSLRRAEIDADQVEKHPGLAPGPYLRLTVSDTGHGIPPEALDRIFDPFFTTKKPGEGTGMGLAIVHGIVKSHGGVITVYSEVGKGTTFHVFLPRVQGREEYPKPKPGAIATGKERILFIDDEEMQTLAGKLMLEKLGYKVVAKTDVREALELFQARPNAFDLVITDQTMPYLTGDRLAERMLAIRPDLPIILCTGFSELIGEEQAKAMGISEFLMKPFMMRELAVAIRRVLDRRGDRPAE